MRFEFVFTNGDDLAVVFVVLILNIPNDFFDQILDGEQAERAARLHGQSPTERLSEDGWVALVFDRGRGDAAT